MNAATAIQPSAQASQPGVLSGAGLYKNQTEAGDTASGHAAASSSLHAASVQPQSPISAQSNAVTAEQSPVAQNTVNRNSAASSPGSLHTDAPAAAHVAHKLQAAESVDTLRDHSQTQTGGAVVDLSVASRASGATHTADTGVSNGPAATGAGSTLRDTFAALDMDSGADASNAIHTGPRHAEAGFQDPVLGWVGIRADAGTTGVHATLTSSSSDAAQVLGGHLAGLNAYLAENRTPVETLTLATSGQQSGLGAGQDTGQAMGQGTNGQAGQQDSSPTPAGAQRSWSTASTAQIEVVPGASGWSGGGAGLEGAHISVVA